MKQHIISNSHFFCRCRHLSPVSNKAAASRRAAAEFRSWCAALADSGAVKCYRFAQ